MDLSREQYSVSIFCENQEPLEFSWSVPSLTVMSVFACPKSFFLFLSIHFILCQPSPAYHITNPFYNSLHFSGLLQTTGLPEIGSLCVCVLEDGLASSLLHAYHSKGPRPIAVWTCGRTLKRKHASVWWKWTDIPSREAKEKRGGGNEPIVYVKVA